MYLQLCVTLGGVAVVAFPCWHERGSEARPGEGICEIRPRSDVLGLEDEATWQGVHAVYFARSLRRKPSKHIAEWVEISPMRGRGDNRGVFLLHTGRFAIKKNSATSRHRVPRLSDGNGER